MTYDISSRVSFEKIDFWLGEVENNCDILDVTKILIGNKEDLIEEREVTTEEGKIKAEEMGCFFFETSAK